MAEQEKNQGHSNAFLEVLDSLEQHWIVQDW